MERFSKKLHSGGGTTIVIALFFFLVCLVFSSVTLAAATSRAERMQSRYTTQNSYLAVSSAARLLKAELGKCSYVTGSVLEQESVYDTDGTTVIGTKDVWTEITPYAAPSSGDLLTDTYAVCRDGSAQESAFTIAAENLPTVDVTFRMQGSGDAVFVLTDPAGAYSAQVTFAARTAETQELASDLFTTSWSAGVITKGAS